MKTKTGSMLREKKALLPRTIPLPADPVTPTAREHRDAAMVIPFFPLIAVKIRTGNCIPFRPPYALTPG